MSKTTPETMPKFTVTVGRSAVVYYTAVIEADTLEQAQSRMSRHGFECDSNVKWREIHTETFDDCENCQIECDSGETHYWDGSDWFDD